MSPDDSSATLPVEFLFSMHLVLADRVVLTDGPHGTRVFVAILGGEVRGPRITATVVPGGSDWVTVRADRYADLDVRLCMTTGDGALIAMTYRGILEPGGAGRPRTAPRFDAAGDGPYAWLNHVQAVAIGQPGDHEVTYAVYAL